VVGIGIGLELEIGMIAVVIKGAGGSLSALEGRVLDSTVPVVAGGTMYSKPSSANF
jgi:hypothetical protein